MSLKIIHIGLLAIFSVSSLSAGSITRSFYAEIIDNIMTTPVSAAMGGSDLSIGTGVSVESTPGNLPFDSLNRLSLSYAGYFGNIFSTSILSYNGKPQENTGIGIMAGYVYIPDILDTRESTSDDSGKLKEARISYYAASKIVFRAGVGHKFLLSPKLTIGAGIALKGKRVRLPQTGYGIGLDGGIKLFFTRPGISMAFLLENLTSSYTYWTENYQERSYVHLRAGIGWERHFEYLYGMLRMSYATPDLFANEGINDITYKLTENDNTIEDIDHSEVYRKPELLFTQGRIGLEYTIMRTVAVRVGLTNGKLGFGAGLRLMNEKAGLDFAYITHALNGTYQLSLQYLW